ncbi:MAG: TMEM175 family protein [Planctomycetota bacterium]
MIRAHLFDKRAPADPLFRWRGGDPSRLEALADGVFALALALLMVSQGAPSSFAELQDVLRDMPAFLVSFLLLVMAWHYHYMFFRRYGLEDFLTIVLNAALLFLVLFYVYPLRFLFLFLYHGMIGVDVEPMYAGSGALSGLMASPERGMMIFYSSGVVGIFGLFALMHLRALRLREQLELDELELFLTRAALRAHGISVFVGVLSLLLAVVTHPSIAGLIYFLMPVLHPLHGFRTGVRADAIHRRMTAEDSG